MESSVLCRFMMTAVPSLKRSATSRASLNRFGSDLWIAEGRGTPDGRAAIVRTTPSASAGTSRTAWGRIRRTGRRLRLGHLVDELLVLLDEPEVVQGLLPHAGHLASSLRPRPSGRSGTEQRRSDPHHRSAFFHRDLVIQRHPHRQFQHVGVLFAQVRPGAREPPEARAGSLRRRR